MSSIFSGCRAVVDLLRRFRPAYAGSGRQEERDRDLFSAATAVSRSAPPRAAHLFLNYCGHTGGTKLALR